MQGLVLSKYAEDECVRGQRVAVRAEVTKITLRETCLVYLTAGTYITHDEDEIYRTNNDGKSR